MYVLHKRIESNLTGISKRQDMQKFGVRSQFLQIRQRHPRVALLSMGRSLPHWQPGAKHYTPGAMRISN
jgi:hypothetical protein